MMRQLHFAITDLELHSRFTSGQGQSIYDYERQVAKKTCVVEPWEGDRFLAGLR